MRNNSCKKYKSCKNVPCTTMNRCKPSYCVPGSFKKW